MNEKSSSVTWYILAHMPCLRRPGHTYNCKLYYTYMANYCQSKFISLINFVILAICLAPTNGLLHCNGVTTKLASRTDYCTFSCNRGYSLQGPQYGICFSLNY